MAAGLSEALDLGARSAARQGATEGGFLDDPRIRIPLPRELDGLARAMERFGLSAEVEALEIGMNRAAERASGRAYPVFQAALQHMTFDNPRAILAGSETAATDEFRRKASDELRRHFQPIVDESIHEVGLARLYGDLMARMRLLPVLLPSTPPLERYVTDRTLEGLFTLMADEERRIRTEPAARTTKRLRREFGGD